MKMTILGSGVVVPSKERRAPGYYLEIDEQKFLIDSGSGITRAMVQADIDYTALDVLFYTHTHIDHTADLIPLLFAIEHNSLKKRTKELLVYGPIGFASFVTRLMQAWGKPKSFDVIVQELSDKKILTIDGVAVFVYEVAHVVHSIGYRFVDKKGRVIAFSGDTGPCKGLLAVAHNADVAVFECSFSEDTKGHLTPTLAGKIAQEAGVKRLILSHMYPQINSLSAQDCCKKQFDGDVIVAKDFLQMNV